MTNICPYCKTPFTGARITKKYCSALCRQQAYLLRKDFTVNKSVDIIGNVKLSDVKTPPEVKIEDHALELLYSKLSNLIESKIAQAVDLLRQEISVKQSLDGKEQLKNVKLCNPCNVNSVTLKPVILKNDSDEIEEPGLCNQSAGSEDGLPFGATTESKDEVGKMDAIQETTHIQETEIKEVDKFQPGDIPKLHLRIEKLLEEQQGDLFNNPLTHWEMNDVKNILWVNIRLRCLLVNLVRMSNFSSVDRESFTELTNGFISLYNSQAFQKLPADYPYANLFAELTDWLRDYAGKQRETNIVKVILTIKRKALLTAICYELTQNTEKVKFSELTFDVPVLPKEMKTLRNKTYRSAA